MDLIGGWLSHRRCVQTHKIQSNHRRVARNEGLIGFYGFGRKSDSYGGVFGELDELDKVARAEKKTKSKEKKNGFDEVFNFSFEF